MMMRFILGLSFFCITHVSIAQISGKVISSDKADLAFVNVILLDANDSTFIKGTNTDLEGRFEITDIPKKEYILNLQMLGYKNWYSSPFDISDKNPAKVFDSINLLEERIELEGVEVKAKRMTFEQNMEGMTINVQSSLLTRGSSALQVLERSPGVIVDQRNGDFSLNGQSGVLVMINGKRVRMSNTEVVNLLRGMSADNIQKVELLTNPSARYDAEGNAGIINIVLKKGEDEGTNGTISLTAGYGWGQKEAVSFNINHRKASTNYYGSYAFSNDDSFFDFGGGRDSESGSNFFPAIGTFQFSRFYNQRILNTQSHNLLVGVEQEINENLTLGLSINANLTKDNPENINETIYNFNQDSLLRSEVNVFGNGLRNNWTTSFFMTKDFNNNGKLELNLDYLFYGNTNPTNVTSSFFNKSGDNIFPEGDIFASEHRGESTTSINIGVAKLDYTKQFSPDWTLEMGLKGAFSKSVNEGIIERLEGNTWLTDNRNISETKIKEGISAAYTSIQFDIDSTTQLMLGARYEYWNRQFNIETLDSKFGKLFPSFFLSKKLSEMNSLTFAYNRRITQPGYNDLASALVYNDPVSVFSGNPLLQPALSNNLRIGYKYKANNFSLAFTNEQNPIARYQIVESEQGDLIIVAPQNVSYQNSLTLQANIPWQVKPWWSINIGGSTAWRQFKLLHTKNQVKKDYLFYNIYGNQNFSLPKDFSLELSGWYVSNHYNGSVFVEGFGMLNMGIKKTLKNNKGSLQFTITDLFKSMNVTSYFGRLTEEAFAVESKVFYESESANKRIFKLSYFRSFGSNKVKKQKNISGAKEERLRLQED